MDTCLDRVPSIIIIFLKMQFVQYDSILRKENNYYYLAPLVSKFQWGLCHDYTNSIWNQVDFYLQVFMKCYNHFGSLLEIASLRLLIVGKFSRSDAFKWLGWAKATAKWSSQLKAVNANNFFDRGTGFVNQSLNGFLIIGAILKF